MKRLRRGGFLIGKIHRLSGRILARMLRAHAVEINPAQGRILFVLWQDDGLPIGELARRTSLGKSTLTSMLDRLEESGHVARSRSEADRRVVVVRRTAKDRACQEAYERVSREFYAGFTDGEITGFERHLVRILDNLYAFEHGDSGGERT
jgi:DNA-binding MarR family transcriptional regulator